jgi:hypothetical protein
MENTIASEVAEALDVQLEMRTEALVAQGMSRWDARREALRQLGDLDGTRECCRRQDEG